MFKKFLKESVILAAGKPAENLTEILDTKKYINEFLIAKKLDLTINQTRNILYRISEKGLVSSTRKKDNKKGWYTYFWKIESVKTLLFLRGSLLNKIEQLENQIKSRAKKEFYHCPKCNIEFNEENALLHDFLCVECENVLENKDNTKLITLFEKNLESLKEELRMIDEEIEKERVSIEKKKEKEKQKIAKEKAEKRAAKRKENKLLKKKDLNKKTIKKIPKKADKKTDEKADKKSDKKVGKKIDKKATKKSIKKQQKKPAIKKDVKNQKKKSVKNKQAKGAEKNIKEKPKKKSLAKKIKKSTATTNLKQKSNLDKKIIPKTKKVKKAVKKFLTKKQKRETKN